MAKNIPVRFKESRTTPHFFRSRFFTISAFWDQANISAVLLSNMPAIRPIHITLLLKRPVHNVYVLLLLSFSFFFFTHPHILSPDFSELIRSRKMESNKALKGGKCILQETTENGRLQGKRVVCQSVSKADTGTQEAQSKAF